MANLDLRPLSLGEILDRAFTLYRRNFLLFLGINAIPHLLTLFFGLIQTSMIKFPISTPGTQTSPPSLFSLFDTMPFGLAGMVLGSILGICVYLFALGGTVHAVSDLYLGVPTSIGQAFGKVRAQFWSLLFTVVLNILAIFGGLFAFLVGAIYVACRLITSVPAALLEGISPAESLGRSVTLTKGNALRAFAIYVLYYFLSAATAALFTYPFTFAMIFSLKDPGMMRMWLALTQIGGTVGNVLVAPVLTIATSVFYYDLRIRKEAFDLQHMLNPGGSLPSGNSGLPSILS